MRDVDWRWHVERLARRNAEVIQELPNTAVSSGLLVGRHGALRQDRNHPASPDLVSELHHLDGQIARIPHMNCDSRFLHPALIRSNAWETPFVGLRKPNADA